MIDSWIHDNYLLISVGSGLSPMLGLYESIVAKQQATSKIAMLFGERYINHILPSTLELFKKDNENIFRRLCLSRQERPIALDKENSESQVDISTKKNNLRPVAYAKKGYVQTGLDEAMEFLGTKEISVFICGKPEMVDDVRGKLVEKWVDTKNIKFEKY